MARKITAPAPYTLIGEDYTLEVYRQAADSSLVLVGSVDGWSGAYEARIEGKRLLTRTFTSGQAAVDHIVAYTK